MLLGDLLIHWEPPSAGPALLAFETSNSSSASAPSSSSRRSSGTVTLSSTNNDSSRCFSSGLVLRFIQEPPNEILTQAVAANPGPHSAPRPRCPWRSDDPGAR